MEALHDGASRNLVGKTAFAGSLGNETPQHAVLLGMQYIALLYEEVFAEESRLNETRLMEVARHACALSRYRRSRPP
jgi:hypothetical protein